MVTSLHLKNFRNHQDITIDFTSSLVAIVGPNASGKTNILESIYVSSFTKSFRTTDTKLITTDNNFYTIDRYNGKDHVHLRFQSTSDKRAKSAKVNSVSTPLNRLIGLNPLTLFEPNDLHLYTGLPAQRRKYIDRILSQVDKKYLSQLNTYTKLLKSRNQLLKNNKRNTVSNIDHLLFVYNVQMAEPATYISQAREKFIHYFSKVINDTYLNITKDTIDFGVTYEPSAPSADTFIEKIQGYQNQDIVVGFSCFGPHREDFLILQDSRPMSEWSSRGEQRSLVLASKLLELDYIEQEISTRPILLLDDVLSELDESRQAYLLNATHMQQTFFTATHLPPQIKKDFQTVELPL